MLECLKISTFSILSCYTTWILEPKSEIKLLESSQHKILYIKIQSIKWIIKIQSIKCITACESGFCFPYILLKNTGFQKKLIWCNFFVLEVLLNVFMTGMYDKIRNLLYRGMKDIFKINNYIFNLMQKTSVDES